MMALPRKDLEVLAEAVRRLADLEPDQIVPADHIVVAVLGEGSLFEAPHLVTTRAALVRVGKSVRVYIRPGQVDRHFLLAHELGHWILRREGHKEWATDEESANHIAGAILAPASTYARAAKAVGATAYDELGRIFHTTSTSAALRDHVLSGADMSIVAAKVRVLKQRFAWPEESVVREWATGDPPHDLTKVKLRSPYDLGRVVLKVR